MTVVQQSGVRKTTLASGFQRKTKNRAVYIIYYITSGPELESSPNVEAREKEAARSCILLILRRQRRRGRLIHRRCMIRILEYNAGGLRNEAHLLVVATFSRYCVAVHIN